MKKIYVKFYFFLAFYIFMTPCYASFSVNPDKLCKFEGPSSDFSGGVSLPSQLYGSFGPGFYQKYLVDKKMGVGPVGHIKLLTGFPNGVTTILWGKGKISPGNNKLTIGCNTGWDCLKDEDPSEIWQSGVIFNAWQFQNKDMEFCHIMKLVNQKYKGKVNTVLYVWETHWPLGQPYTCPGTLQDALKGKGDFKDKVHYIVAPQIGIGLHNISKKYWTCKGELGGVFHNS